MKLILVRYGSHIDGNLSDQGVAEIKQIANELQQEITPRTIVIAAGVERAEESASLLCSLLNLKSPKVFPELYADPEHGIAVDGTHADELLRDLSTSTDSVIAVISREYIEHFLNVAGESGSLSRGEYKIVTFSV